MRGYFVIGLLTPLLAVGVPAKAAPTETVIYSFTGGADGAAPISGLLAGPAGNFYTTVLAGDKSSGPGSSGSIVKLSPPLAGKTQWIETTLYGFDAGVNGGQPKAGLIADKAGNLYTSTNSGGVSANGTIVKLSPPAAGATKWSETTLYRFKGVPDGDEPFAGLIFDSAGNLYTTTENGGSTVACTYGCGTVVKLSPPASGQTHWTETILHRFAGGATDGAYPQASLTTDRAGNLYTTTNAGGTITDACAGGCGTIVKLSPPTAGETKWTETVIYRFNYVPDGYSPRASLIFDRAGNLYTTTGYGGPSDAGTIVRLSPPTAGKTNWTETVLFSFAGSNSAGSLGGYWPGAGLISDAAGNFYVTASAGGIGSTPGNSGNGTIVKVSPPATGKTTWTSTILYRFNGAFEGGQDGSDPGANLNADHAGNLYTTTQFGGANGKGAVIKLSGAGFVVGTPFAK
jgi:hypothetical protein